MVLTEQEVKKTDETEFKPKLLGFVCNWCSYGGADAAGQLHLNYPVHTRLIRVMCSGRVDPQLMIDALKKADLVFVAGCHLPNDCHYKTGNHFARTRVNMMQSTLMNLGINPQRLQMLFISPSEAKEFASAMQELTELATNLGPNPLRLENEIGVKVIES